MWMWHSTRKHFTVQEISNKAAIQPHYLSIPFPAPSHSWVDKFRKDRWPTQFTTPSIPCYGGILGKLSHLYSSFATPNTMDRFKLISICQIIRRWRYRTELYNGVVVVVVVVELKVKWNVQRDGALSLCDTSVEDKCSSTWQETNFPSSVRSIFHWRRINKLSLVRKRKPHSPKQSTEPTTQQTGYFPLTFVPPPPAARSVKFAFSRCNAAVDKLAYDIHFFLLYIVAPVAGKKKCYSHF